MVWFDYLMGGFFLLLIVGTVVGCVWYCKSFYAERAKRQEKVEEQRNRNGGEYILEWSGETAEGSPDPDFGRLLVVIPAKLGDGSVSFYEKGLVMGGKRLPYAEVKDVVYAAGTPGKKLTAKAAMRDSAVMWIYPKKGAAFAIRELSYRFDDQTMEAIKQGLGF